MYGNTQTYLSHKNMCFLVVFANFIMTKCLTLAGDSPNSRQANTWKGHDDVIKWKLFSALLAFCAGNSPVTGEFPAQRPVTRSFDVFFDLRWNKRLSKQSWGWWFETPSS